MPARFDKTVAHSSDLFDGFDSKTVYQMVPSRGSRPMGIVTSDESVTLIVNDPSVATTANFMSLSGPFGPPLTADSLTLPSRARITFSILGKLAGHTEIVLQRADGLVQASLLLSVKDILSRTVHTIRLSDIRKTTDRTAADLAVILPSVHDTYLRQANVDLQMASAPVSVTVPRVLGKTIFLDKFDIFKSIIQATPVSLFGPANAIRVYCCWDVEDRDIPGSEVGLTLGSNCFVEDGGLPTDFVTRLTFGHEIGHALGLDHNGDIGTMMFKTTAARSSKLFQFEIDTINASGTVIS